MRTPNASQSADPVSSTFASTDTNHGVYVIDGYGLRVHVERGHLVVVDGLGRHRRERRFSRATHGLSRLVVLGHGQIRLDAIRWMADVGVTLVYLDCFNGQVLAMTTIASRDDARLPRAQALAVFEESGLTAGKSILTANLAGQESFARNRLGCPVKLADKIAELEERLDEASDIDEARQVEAAAANVYWSAWEKTRLRFIRKDASRIPDHWLTFEGRRSTVMFGTARHATDPVNALLNYGYRLAEVEARIACLSFGLDPGLGVIHRDFPGRDSLALDVMEAARPAVDSYVLDLVEGHVFSRADFHEDRSGVVRVLAPLSHRLAEAVIPLAGRAVVSIAGEVAGILAEASPYPVKVSSYSKGARSRRSGSAGAPRRVRAGVSLNPAGLPPRKKPRQRPSIPAKARLPMPTCVICGATLPQPSDRSIPRRRHCERCLTDRREELCLRLPALAAAAASHFEQLGGQRPAQTGEARTRRSTANAADRAERRRWDMQHAREDHDPEWFRADVLPGLAGVTLPATAKATGVSTSTASKIRSGRRTPHPRHWKALVELAMPGAPENPDSPGGALAFGGSTTRRGGAL